MYTCAWIHTHTHTRVWDSQLSVLKKGFHCIHIICWCSCVTYMYVHVCSKYLPYPVYRDCRGTCMYLYSPHTFGNSVLTFNFRLFWLFTILQHNTCQNKAACKIFSKNTIFGQNYNKKYILAHVLLLLLVVELNNHSTNGLMSGHVLVTASEWSTNCYVNPFITISAIQNAMTSFL